MPQWGRPLGAQMGRNKRSGKKRWEGSRVEELDRDGDSDGEEGVPLNPRMARDWQQRDQLQLIDRADAIINEELTESDLGTSDDEHDEYTLEEAYQDSTLAYAIELAMKDKDDRLVERALDRIRNAQIMGLSKIKLTQRELDALERRRVQSEAMTASRRNRSSRAKGKTTPSKLNVKWPPEPVYPAAASTPAAPYTSAIQMPQSRPRTPSVQTLRMQPNMSPRIPGSYQFQDETSYTSRPSSSGRTQPLSRPLPDDPQWIPNSRRSSNAMPMPPATYASYVPAQVITFDPRYPVPASSNYALSTAPDAMYQPVYRPSSRESYPDRAAALSNITLQPAPGNISPRRVSSGSGTSSSDNGVQVNTPKGKEPAKTTTNGRKTNGTPKKTPTIRGRRTRK